MKKSLLSTATLVLATLAIAFNACKPKDQSLIENKDSVNNEYLIMSVLYQQHAAEYKALCYQAFNIAKVVLDNDLMDKGITAKRAIVVDVDETVLDNSPFEARCILENTEYPKYWDEWVIAKSAKAIPGALEFLDYASRLNVEIFYITNRKSHLKQSTIDNLKQVGFPNADTVHVLARTKDNSKEPRRESVAMDYHIVMFIGDNLADFTKEYDKAKESRTAITDSLQDHFGNRFIVIPNAMYGDWESALFQGKELTKEEKAQFRKKALINF